MTESVIRHTLFDLIASDLVAHKLLPRNTKITKLRILRSVAWCHMYHPAATCVIWYRINRHFYLKKWPMRNFISARRYYWFSNDISFYADIGPGFRIVHAVGIVIGAAANIGRDVTIFNGVTIGAKRRNEGHLMPTLGDGVLIGSGAKVLGPIKVGHHVTIGALSFCAKDIPDNSVVYGIPPNLTIKQESVSHQESLNSSENEIRYGDIV
jgi:serine O-acetyltransferase